MEPTLSPKFTLLPHTRATTEISVKELPVGYLDVHMSFADPLVGQTHVVTFTAANQNERLVEQAAFHLLLARIKDIQLKRTKHAACSEKQVGLLLSHRRHTRKK